MAGMTVSITGSVSPYFLALAKKWPDLTIGLLHHIGYEGRDELYQNFLRGQVIDLKAYPKDVRGRRTATYSWNKSKTSMLIKSYPLNLFNPQSVYASASGPIEARVKSSLKNYDEKVLKKRLEELEGKEGKIK